MKEFDYVIVGSGLFGATFAHEMTTAGKRCLVLDKRAAAGGNIRCESIEGINCHLYGPHIFHTNDEKIWQYVNRLATFNNFVYAPMASYRGDLYNLPFNMHTFYQIWNIQNPAAARRMIQDQGASIKTPANLEEQAIKLVGRDVYHYLVEGYTQKQWGRACKELPASIIKRLPVRFTFDNNYFNDRYQGIPVGGYNQIIEKLLAGSRVYLNVNYLDAREHWNNIADQVVYSGPLDEFFGYEFGRLEYRSLRFETQVIETDNYQGCAVINYTDADIPYTRVIEHKHFERTVCPWSVVTKEFPVAYSPSREPYYPVNDEANNSKYSRYQKLADASPVIFGGRLASYQYYNMDQVIAQALKLAAAEHKKAPQRCRA